MPSIDFAALKELVSVRRALELLWWRPVRRAGGQLRGPCPVHGSKRPGADTFAAAEREWYCHKCKRGGSVIDLWAGVRSLPLYEAALDLCRAAGVDPPLLARRGAPPPRPRADREEAL